MEFPFKYKRNYFVLMNRYIRILALSFGEILREFGEILGKYRMLNGRSVGSKGLKQFS